MARNGYLIMDSDLHMMEPDDLWARYLDEPYRTANPPRFFGGQQEKLTDNPEDKGNTDAIAGMEVQGLAIPAHATQMGATVSSRELQRRSRARHPHFRVARARGYDPASTLTAMDIEGIDVAVMYGTRGRQILCHDNLAPDYAAALETRDAALTRNLFLAEGVPLTLELDLDVACQDLSRQSECRQASRKSRRGTQECVRHICYQ